MNSSLTLSLSLALVGHLGCPAVVHDVSTPAPSGGAGGVGAQDAGSTSAVGGLGGDGGLGGTGGEGGSPCVLGTSCAPIATGTVFEGQGNARSVAVDGEGDLVVYGSFHELAIAGETVVSEGASDLWLAKLDAITGAPVWVRSFGTADWDKSSSLAIDGDGNVVITGTARAAIDFGGGAVCETGFTQVFLAKIDRDGNHIFSRCFGDPATSTGGPDVAVATTPTGEIVLAGNAHDDLVLGSFLLPAMDGMAFVATLSPSGEVLWADRYVEWSNYLLDAMVRGVAVSPSGDIFIATSFRGVLDFEGVVYDSDGDGAVAVARLRPDGSLSWVKAVRGEQISQVTLAATPSEGVLVSGTHMDGFMTGTEILPLAATLVSVTSVGTVAFATDLPEAAYRVAQSAVADDGTVLSLATVYVADDPTVVVASFSPEGSLLSQHSFGAGEGFDLALGGDTLAVTGLTSAPMDFGQGPTSGEDGVFLAWFKPWQDALGIPAAP